MRTYSRTKKHRTNKMRKQTFNVGDKVIGISGGWEGVVGTIIFVAPSGNIGEIQFPEVTEQGVQTTESGIDFRHIQKVKI